MSSRFGKNISIQIFGQSHSEGIGVVMEGLPPGMEVDLGAVQRFLDRRAPGRSRFATARRESDTPHLLSGLLPVDTFSDRQAAGLPNENHVADGRFVTCGAPLCAVFENSDTKSSDYDAIRYVPRPSHADWNAYYKYKGANDVRGGGHFSGRLTLPLCFAGAVCIQLLEKRGITIGSHLSRIGGIQDSRFDPVGVGKSELERLRAMEFPVLDCEAGKRMAAQIELAKNELDSVGGEIECAILSIPQGLGEPMFDGFENRLAAALFGIPAVKGVEFGSGFGAASMRGSEHNDPYCCDGGRIYSKTNHAGGILGGITTGMPVIFRVAIKPTPSIARAQQSVDLRSGTNTTLEIHGRHDPCIAPRALACVEAAAAVTVLDFLLEPQVETK